MSKAHVLITPKKGKHKSQPWTYTIDKPGGAPLETANERYTRRRSAVRGALRALDAQSSSGLPGRTWSYTGGYAWFWKGPKGKVYPIKVVEPKK